MIKLGSLFDGSGGFPLAGQMHGIVPVWASEIEPFPIRVTKLRFPDMKHLGSVTDVDGGKVEPVDIITFGSPCQDLSVAGKQEGIHDGKRSNLFFEAVRIIREMRNATSDQYPRFAVWENVPGAFSSNKGEDFRDVLQALCEIRGGEEVSVPKPPKGKWLPAGCIVGNGWSLAWRVYDAQFWGVPQRRKRIYLIADFGSERAGEIFFEPDSVCWNPAESGEAGKGTSEDAEGSAGGSTLAFSWNNSGNAGLSAGGTSPTIKATRSGEPAVCCECGAFCAGASPMARSRGNGSNGGKGFEKDIQPTMTAMGSGAVCVGNGQLHQTDLGDKTGALNCMHDQQAIIEQGKGSRKYIVRRLTPTECARLQGFPDWWTDGADGSDSAKYKLWGNGIALPCAADVLGRIAEELRRENHAKGTADGGGQEGGAGPEG